MAERVENQLKNKPTDWNFYWSLKKHVWSRYFRIIFNLLFIYGIRKILRNNSSIIELGLGSGTILKMLSSRGYHCVGVDFSEKALERSVFERGATIMADARHLPFRSNTFNIAIGQGLLEHLPPGEILNVIREAKKVSAHQVFSVPLRRGLMHMAHSNKLFKKVHLFSLFPPEEYYDENTLYQILKEAHLSLEFKRLLRLNLLVKIS